MNGSGEPAVTSTGRTSSVRRHPDALTRPTQMLLVLFGVLTALGVLALLVGATRTDRSFAWTINPPLAAAFCGAGYGAGLVLVVLTLRADRWSQARWPLATILVFTVLTLIASLVHLPRFHLSSPLPLAVAAAWFWLAVYVVVPLGIAAVMVLEERRFRAPSRHGPAAAKAAPASAAASPAPRREAAAAGPSAVSAPPQSVFSAFLLVQGVLLTVTGTLLYLNVAPVLAAWPWTLTPLVAMVTGAWLISFGVAALFASRVDISTLGPATAGYTTFGALQLLAVVLYRGDFRPGAAATAYLVVAAWVGATGAWGWWMARRHRGQ